MATYYSAEEVDEMLEKTRQELIDYVNKQIVMGREDPDNIDANMYLKIEKDEPGGD